MPLPQAFLSLLRDPGPGLVFGPNHAAGLGRRALPAPHHFGAPAGWFARRSLRSMCRAGGTLEELADFFDAHNGISLCVRQSPENASQPALAFLPLSAWDQATATALANNEGRLFRGLDAIYTPGDFRVIASCPSEGTLLTVLLKQGADESARPGAIYYVSMKPVCDPLFPFAPGINALCDALANNPAGVFARLGYLPSVRDGSGAPHPDPVESYVPDVRSHPDFAG